MYLIFYTLMMIFSLLASLFIVVLMWQRRQAPGARAMMVLAASTFIWTSGFLGEAYSNTLKQQLFLTNIAYIGLMSVPVAWFVFALHYTGNGRFFKRWKILLLCIFPLITIALVWSNNWHHLMWSNERLVISGPFTVTAKTYGLFFWMAVVYNYTLVILGVIILIRSLFTSTVLHRRQSVPLIIAVSLPFVWNVIYVFDLVPLPHKDLTPAMFAISGVAIAVGLMRFHLFKAVPFAYRLIIQQLKDGVLIFDLYNHLLEANPAVLKMMETNGDVIGKDLKDLIPLSPLLEQISPVKFGSFDVQLTLSGSECFYELETKPIIDNRKTRVGWLAILRDITGRIQAEKERLEIERKAQNANRLASIGEMAAGIAHEINNPLTPVLGFADLLSKRDLPEEVQNELSIIVNNAKQAADITRRMLTFARQNKPVRRYYNINEVVELTVQLRMYHLKTNNINVKLELAPNLPQMAVDAGQLQQVFLNLIINAEYEMIRCNGRGNLTIKTEKEGEIIRISVEDNGPGIPETTMEKIFTPFFTTKGVGEGTGLGLSVCHGIVTEHNGKIYARSEPGKGATFIVELPVTSIQPEKVGPSGVEMGVVKDASRYKILVVDDEPAIVEVLQQILVSEGFEVDATSNATEALRLIMSEDYAIVLLDIRLPGMSGIELYQHLNNRNKSLAQKIIFVTGDVLNQDIMDFFSQNKAVYVTKPFNTEEVKNKVQSKLLLLSSLKPY